MHELWERLAAGRLAAVIAAGPPVVPVWLNRAPCVVRCAPDQPMGPLRLARERLERRAEERPAWHAAAARARRGLRARLLGEPEPDRGDALVEALNDAAAAGPPALLVLDAAEEADPDTLLLLLRAAHRPRWLELPVLIVLGEVPADGPAAALARALAAVPLVPEAEAAPPEIDLPTGPRRALRAAAWLGSPFSAADVAALIGVEPVHALLDLQDAADAGVPLDDDGAGQFTLDPAWVGALRDGLLPSLAAAWAARTAPAEEEADADEAVDQARDAVDRARDAWLAGEHEAAIRLAAAAAAPEAPREVRIAALADLAWYQHQRGALDEAGRAADEAVALLHEGDPAALVAAAHAQRAGIAYERGEPAALAGAVEDLSRAAAAWAAAGEPVEAARVGADQAAVRARRGELDLATALLRESRAAFEARAGADPEARLALAEADHLLGRLPFHLSAGEAVELEGLRAAVAHATRAERAYLELRRPREAARVWETLGRLEVRLGRVGAAVQRLSEAVRVQREIGDDLGLARTTGALAEALADGGRLNEAISLLADSIALNTRTGTAEGLAVNRTALEALRARGMGRPEVQRALDALSERLKKAERAAAKRR